MMRFSVLFPGIAFCLLAACDRAAPPPPPALPDRMPPSSATEPPAPKTAPVPATREEPAPKVAIAAPDGGKPHEITDSKLLPLARILEIARRRVPGQVIEVDLDDDDDDPPEYELEILTADGRKIEMRIDARTGAILEVEED